MLCEGENSLCQQEDTSRTEEDDSGSAREVSSFTYYPVDSNVLSNIMGSVQVGKGWEGVNLLFKGCHQ